MGSLDNLKPWVPYMNTKDCSQGFCSLYCPQWCHLIIPPPPTYSSFSSSSTTANNSVPGPSFSPLVIAIIGILASALLLVSYYAIISKYCGNAESSVNNRTIQDQTMAPNEDELEDNGEQLGYWMTAAATGLDEALIKSITLCKYKKSDGLIDGTDCSVCLAEFEDDEELRLLPKCGHAFHVECIDTWLKSHTNCPLCRANVVLSAFNNDRRQQPSIQPPLPPLVPVPPHPPLPQRDSDDLQNRYQQRHNETGHDPEDELRIHLGDHASGSRNERVCENHFRALSDLGDSGLRHTIIEVNDGSCRHSNTAVRRSVSMDTSHQLRRLSIADILHINQADENYQVEEELCQLHGQIGSSKGLTLLGESSKSSSSSRSKVLHCVKNSVAMKRSFWIERSLSARYGRKSVNAILPV